MERRLRSIKLRTPLLFWNLAGVEVVETQITVEVTVGGESDGWDVGGEVVSHRVEVTESWHLWVTNIVVRSCRICPN